MITLECIHELFLFLFLVINYVLIVFNYEYLVWAPIEQGLHDVVTVRQIPQLKITLATDPSSLDKDAPGYQEPASGDDFALSSEYHYPEETDRGNKGNRGGKSRGRGKGGSGSGSGSGRGRGKGGSSGTRGGRGGGRGRGRGY